MDFLSTYQEYLIYERQLAGTTTDNYMFFIKEFLGFIRKDCEEVNREDIRAFLKHLRKRGIKQSSVTNYVISLRSFYNWMSYAVRTEELNQLSFFLNKIVKIKRERVVPEVPTITELDKLRNTLEAYKRASSFNKKMPLYKLTLRDCAIFEMLIATGLRSAELRNVRMCDVDLDNSTVFVEKGKGGAQRVSIFSEHTKAVLKEYIEYNSFESSERIFIVRNGNMLNYIIKRWAKRASINQKIHAHSFRHFHITEAQRQGVPMQVVADQVGHVSLNTTRNYTHLDLNHRRDQYKDCNI